MKKMSLMGIVKLYIRAQIKDPEKVTNKMYGCNTDISSHFLWIFNLCPSSYTNTSTSTEGFIKDQKQKCKLHFFQQHHIIISKFLCNVTCQITQLL